MMQPSRILAVAVLLCAAAACKPTASNESADAAQDVYRPGQVWSYKNRPGEDESRLTVLKIDHDAQRGTIVHVAVAGLHMKGPSSPGGEAREIGHMPLSSGAMDASIVHLVSPSGPIPEFHEGYDLWRDAFDHGKGGIFTIPVAEAITGMEGSLNR